MEREQRIITVQLGLVFTLGPALLFLPGIRFLALCPPTYATAGVRVMLAAFLAAEIWALRKLLPSLNLRHDKKVDRVNLLVWVGCSVAALMSLVSLGLLLIGYPRPY
jgi:hypothetical protein